MILYHGTTLQNLDSILRHGLIASGGRSLHNTKTRSMLFLTDDIQGAFVYAAPDCYNPNHPDKVPVVLEVILSDTSKLEPDYDDVDIGGVYDYLSELAESLGIDPKDISLDEPLDEDLYERVRDRIDHDKMSYEYTGILVDANDKSRTLSVDPIVFLHLEMDDIDPEILDDGTIDWDDSGLPGLWTRQYRYKGQISTADIKAVWSPEEVASVSGVSKSMKNYACWSDDRTEVQMVNMVRNLVW